MLIPPWTRPSPIVLGIYIPTSLSRPLIAPQLLRTFTSLRSSRVDHSPLKAPPSHRALGVPSLAATSRRAPFAFLLSSPTRDAGRRSFSSSARRQDVFFVSVPAFKQGLLVLVRIGLILLPVYVSVVLSAFSHQLTAAPSPSAWRWGFFRRFPKQAGRLWQLPLLAVLAVIGLGLNQSPRTAR